MKKLLLSLGLGILSFAGFSQVELDLTGSCQYAGSYEVKWADESFWDGSGGNQSWNTPNMFILSNAVTANLVLVQGQDPTPHGNCTFDMACNGVTGITNAAALAGNIAVIRRGACEFGSKALAAQNAGAVACIIVNAVGDPIGMNGGTDGGSVTIPTAMVSANTGAIICDAITAGCPQAYFGNVVGLNADNISCVNVYRPGRALDYNWPYHDANKTFGFTPGALISNLGTNGQNGITLNCKIFEIGNTNPIYDQTSPAFDLPGVVMSGGIPSDSSIFIELPPFTSNATNQDFEFIYTVNAPNTPDATPADNVVQSYFGIRPDRFSLAQVDPSTQKPFATGGAGPTTSGTNALVDAWEICSHYSDDNSRSIAIGNWFQAYTYSPTDPNTTLLAKTVISVVYEWTNYYGIYDMTDPNFTTSVANDTNKFTELTRGTFFYQGDYQDSIVYQAYDNSVFIDQNKHYLFCNRVETNGDVSTLSGLNFRLDAKTDYTATNGGYVGITSPTGGAPTTVAIDDGTFYSAGYGFDNAINTIIKLEQTDVGVQETENNRELIAYPNPAVDMITIPFGNVTGNATINIIDVAGRTVSTQVVNLTGGNVTLDVTNLESGLYTFNVNYADGSKGGFKIVITK